MYESQANISLSINQNVATLTFQHPASNSFTAQMLSDFVDSLNDLSQNADVKLVVLKSHGDGVFCAGASFDELKKISNLKNGTQFFSGFANAINAMRNCAKLIVGRVQGKAVGGGIGLISACDYVFATQNSSVKLSEIAIGIGPFVIEPAITRKIGITNFSQLALKPSYWKSADWALEKGLFSEIFETQFQLDTAVLNFTTELSSYPLESLTELKKVLWQNTNHWNVLLDERAAISGQLALSDFAKNALEQFKK